MSATTPTAIIDLEALSWNYRFLREKAAPAETGAAIKANAYGLGMNAIATTLRKAGCRTFFTAYYGEARELRSILSDVTIVVLHGIDESDYDEAATRHITPTINHLGALETWRNFARRQGAPLPAFIHLDTGMNRLGLSPDEQTRLRQNLDWLDGIAVKAWMSHLARADEHDESMTTEQRDRFTRTLQGLPAASVSLCNSSGIFWGHDYIFDLVRPGIALYGGNPTPRRPNPMRPVLELKAPILQTRDVTTSMTVGYGAMHNIERKGRVATLGLGYADGYSRALSNRGKIKFGEFLAPLIGRISMDLITVDVTDVPETVAHAGAMATVIGEHRPIDVVAAEASTIPHEILTSLGPRIERIYKA